MRNTYSALPLVLAPAPSELIQVAIGQYQVQLIFDDSRAVSIGSRYAVLDPDGQAEEFTDMPAGASRLVSLLGGA